VHEDVQFFYHGIRDIEEVMMKLLQGCGRNYPVELKAKRLYQNAYELQLAQKEGKVRMNKNKKKRERFARRKQFVVACVWWALLQHGYNDKWTIEEISNQLEGIDVSKYSVKKCLRDLKLY
jgi:hypothetical protein